MIYFRCIGELLKAAAAREEHPLIEDPLAPKERIKRGVLVRKKRSPIGRNIVEGCATTIPCLKLMLSNRRTSQYKITHQLLYTSVAELVS